MGSTTTWLPRPPQSKRLALFWAYAGTSRSRPLARFSEFLTAENIRFFNGYHGKIEVVESLVKTLPGSDHRAVLQAIWNREREGALAIKPDVAILRGRLSYSHHLRAALGICPQGIIDPSHPDGLTRILIVFAGPTNQTRMHAAFLVAASSLFHQRGLVNQLTRMESPANVLSALRDAEGVADRAGPWSRLMQPVFHFFRMYFAWNRVESL